MTFTSLSSEQGDVEIIRRPLSLMAQVLNDEACQDALAALDRLAAELVRAEREKQEADEYLSGILDTTEAYRARAEKAERALGEIADGSWGRKAQHLDYDVREFARAALARDPEWPQQEC